MPTKVFVDGREGTTGLEIADVLDSRSDLELLSLDDGLHKDISAKRAIFEEAEIVFLCLPDSAAAEAAKLSANTRIIDASTVHRIADSWIYGLPELCKSQRDAIANAEKVSNPGCYPTGFILALRPLIDTGLVGCGQLVNVHAVSGFSGGGKKLIAKYRDSLDSSLDTLIYGLSLNHKHLPEMQRYSGLSHAPLFVPSVGPFYRGMLVCVAFHGSEMRNGTSPQDIVDVYQERYQDEPFVKVSVSGEKTSLDDEFLAATRCNHTNNVELCVFGHESQVLVVACLDNLGKGAATAAVQNMNLMLGIDETTGLLN